MKRSNYPENYSDPLYSIKIGIAHSALCVVLLRSRETIAELCADNGCSEDLLREILNDNVKVSHAKLIIIAEQIFGSSKCLLDEFEKQWWIKYRGVMDALYSSPEDNHRAAVYAKIMRSAFGTCLSRHPESTSNLCESAGVPLSTINGMITRPGRCADVYLSKYFELLGEADTLLQEFEKQLNIYLKSKNGNKWSKANEYS